MSTYLLLIIPVGFLIAAFLGFIVRLVQRATFRRGTVIAEYEAPHLLSAAELGYLVDKDFGENELLATAIALVGKGFIDIRKHEPNNPLLITLDIKDSEFKKMNEAEIAVFSTIRNQKFKTIAWKDITNVFSTTLGARAGFEHDVKGALIHKGYLDAKSPFAISRLSKHLVYAAIIVFAALLTWAYFFASEAGISQDFRQFEREISIFTLLFIGAVCWLPLAYYLELAYLIYYYAANQPINITDKFRTHWHDVAGFQLFIRTVEFSRLDADTNPHDPAMPYAIALGFNPDMNKMTDLALRK
jgi:hypothetical protein